MTRRTAFALVLLLAGSRAATAQTSVYAVLGPGLPGRPVGVEARAMGGATAATDPASPVNPAMALSFGRLTAIASMATAFRSYEAGGERVTGLQDTRFPNVLVGGAIPGSRLAVSLSYGLYADRTFDVRTADTIVLRSEPVAVADQARSQGGIADVRAALAWAAGRALWVGIGVHILSGSTRESVRRQFGDTAFAAMIQRRDTEYSATGLSFGVLATPANWIRLGGTVRQDFGLSTTASIFPVGDMNLPLSVSGGAIAMIGQVARVAVAGTWTAWSRAQDGLADYGTTRAFDTWEVGFGTDVGGSLNRVLPVPLRLGVRYGQLPFSPNDEQPHEWSVGGGTGLLFAEGRAMIDLSLERVLREGAGATERVWQFSAGVRIRP